MNKRIGNQNEANVNDAIEGNKKKNGLHSTLMNNNMYE